MALNRRLEQTTYNGGLGQQPEFCFFNTDVPHRKNNSGLMQAALMEGVKLESQPMVGLLKSAVASF